jgi:hypothetical protein
MYIDNTWSGRLSQLPKALCALGLEVCGIAANFMQRKVVLPR